MMIASRAEQNSTSTSVANIPGKFATIGAFSPHVLPQRVASDAKRFAKSQSPKNKQMNTRRVFFAQEGHQTP
jgi:hypothetical protein